MSCYLVRQDPKILANWCNMCLKLLNGWIQGEGPRGRSLGGGPRRTVPGVPEPPFSSCLTPKFSLQQDCKLLINMKDFKSTDLEIFFSSFKL